MPLPLPQLSLSEVCRRIEVFIREKLEEADATGVIVGLSGGVDSSTAASLCARALGPEKVLGLIIPDKRVTPREDVEDAKLIAERLGIEYKIIEISPICDAITSLFPNKGNHTVEGNVKARVRMVLLYHEANRLKRLVVGSGDRSELLIGYYTKYGDGGADLLPLGGLFKTQVRELAKFLGVPQKIATKPSSPRLWAGHTVEAELGMSYDVIDPILHGLVDLGMTEQKIAKELGIPLDMIKKIRRMIKNTEHKRRMPLVAEI